MTIIGYFFIILTLQMTILRYFIFPYSSASGDLKEALQSTHF